MIKKKQLHRKKKHRETKSRIVLTRGEFIETGTTHVTPAGCNIFLDLGFAPEEAARLLAESDQEIERKMAIAKCSHD